MSPSRYSYYRLKALTDLRNSVYNDIEIGQDVNWEQQVDES